MGRYLNTDSCFKNFHKLYNNSYFVDKSLIIGDLNNRIGTNSQYICITRPRRFGKTSIAEMLGAYYCKAIDSKEIFDTLKIKNSNSYNEYLNKCNIIKISFNEFPDNNLDNYEAYINRIKSLLTEDIINAYPHLKRNNYQDKSLNDLLIETGDEFIFILDEWDYIFGTNQFVEHQADFLRFLMNLLKDKPYVSLCYMTGVLPIKKYSDTSELNMFNEFNFLKDRVFGRYFGFTEEEVKVLCQKNQNIKFEELEDWYNGYSTANNIKLYNPRSVICALENNYCESYWTNTGSMNGVLEYLKYNILDVRDDVIKMVSGEEIEINIDEEFRAGQFHPKTREEIYSAMIVLGFLSYYDGYIKIPNKELLKEFEKALRDSSFGIVSEIVNNSKKLLDATVNGDAKAVEDFLHNVHNSEIPILQYNDENSLACVVNLAYLSARDYYRIEREEKTGKGYADFMFHPKRKNRTGFIIELKKDDSVDNAIAQIKEKEYSQKLKLESNCSKILAVAICYDSKTKEHHCKIEEL